MMDLDTGEPTPEYCARCGYNAHIAYIHAGLPGKPEK